MKFPIMLMAVICLAALYTSAQTVDPAKKTAESVNKTIDKGLNGLEGATKNLFKKKDKTVEEKPAEKPAEKKDAITMVAKDTAAPQEPESLKTYSKFDFVPGEKIIFFDDFSGDNVGDFPAAWNTDGSGEIVTSNLFPGKWLKYSGRIAIWTDELLKLPDNYTIEFDVVPIEGEEGGMGGYSFRLMQSINAKAYDHGAVPGKAGFQFYVEYFGRPNYRTYMNEDGGELLGVTGQINNDEFKEKMHEKYHISVWVQKSRVRLYQNENKIIDLPKAFPLASVKMDRIRFEENAALITNVRIAVGAPDMRSKLITDGKLVTYGINFDVNSAKLKPESYGTLKGIADVLKENPDVKVQIVGHTDSDGSDATNLDLSKRRAASVKAELTKTFGIDAARMETDGKGETQPVAENNSVTNKALNRRVEFIKL